MRFDITILGSNSAIPAHGRHPSAQVVNIHDHLLLIDCGEGTQMQLDRYKIRKSRIDHIFISHLHGDHYFGLIGLLTTQNLLGREKALTVYSPPGLREILNLQFQFSGTQINFPLAFVEIQEEKLLLENGIFTIEAVALEHRIPTYGFLISEKERPPNLIKEIIHALGVPMEQLAAVKNGADAILPDGKQIANADLVLPAAPPRQYAYFSDTRYVEALANRIKGFDALYHETTFTNDRLSQAELTLHSTARQAATLAANAGVGILITGHYSSRYHQLDKLLLEAQMVFPNTVLGEEGKTYSIPLQERVKPT